MTISPRQRQQTEARIRAAADRLLAGTIPAGGKCDVRTLAAEAGVSRAALYRTYPHLKQEFEQRRGGLRPDRHPDPRDALIARLTADNTNLRARVADLERQADEAKAFRVSAISRLAAQHDEIQRLRTVREAPTNVVILERPHVAYATCSATDPRHAVTTTPIPPVNNLP